MRYFVTIGERVFEVDVLDGGRVTVDGRETVAGLAGDGPLRHLLLDGRSYPLLAEPAGPRGQWTLRIDGHRFTAEALDERTRAIRDMTSGTRQSRGPLVVRAPMPGLVLRIEVETGQTVQAGQGIVIMEAMKMENELRADGGGIVSRILASPGDAVEKGTVLVEFEAP